MKPPKRVSVIDDDEIVRDTVVGWLARAGGYRLHSAHARAEDALAALPETRPDIVILDVRMGRMDGLECLDALRPLLPRTTIILHTAYGDADVLHHALAGGANGFVQKDGQPATLFPALAHATNTGLYPNPGPFEVQTLEFADQLATDCNSIPPFSRQFAFTRSLMPYGNVVLRVIWIDYSATRFWPFQVKAL